MAGCRRGTDSFTFVDTSVLAAGRTKRDVLMFPLPPAFLNTADKLFRAGGRREFRNSRFPRLEKPFLFPCNVQTGLND